MAAQEEVSYKQFIPTNILRIYNNKLVSADEAVKHIKSGDNIVVQPGCAAPMELIRALVRRKDELKDITLYHILIVGDLPYLHPGMEKISSIKHFLSELIPVRQSMMAEQSLFQSFYPKFLFFSKTV